MATHVFFDFFGTLVDYDAAVHPAENAPLAFARRFGAPVGRDEVDARWQRAWDDLEDGAERTGREFSMRQVAQRYWRSIGAPPLCADAIDTLIAEYLDAWTQGVTPAHGAGKCLADLATDHRLVIVSNTHDPALVPRLVRRFGFDTTIDRVITSVAVGWRKPHPAIFETALRDCGIRARDAVFVGDNWQADVEGPRAVGMAAIYVGRPAALRPVVTISELPQAIRSLP